MKSQAYQILGVFMIEYLYNLQHVNCQRFADYGNSAVLLRHGHGPAVRASRLCNGALTALQQAPRCTLKAVPSQSREALAAGKQ